VDSAASSSEVETNRLAALRRYRVLDSEPEEAFDRIVHLAQALFDMPAAMVSFIDDKRQWFKARVGIDIQETPRAWAFCNHAIQQAGPLVVPDARDDPRFSANPLVLGEPFIRFYAGATIRTPDNQAIGTVCVLSPDPRTGFSTKDQERLSYLADIVSHELELRLVARRAQRYAENLEVLSQEIHNQVANSLQLIADVLEIQAGSTRDRTVAAALKNALMRVTAVGSVHRQLRQQSSSESGDAKAYLGMLMRAVWRGLAPDGPDRGIAVDVPDRLSLPTDLLPRLGMVATELVMNAIRFGRGTISVSVAPVPGGIVLTVDDEGDGLPPGAADTPTPGNLGFQLIRMLAGDNALAVDPANPRRVTVAMRA
jgi:two-component sensor histidine kinase